MPLQLKTLEVNALTISNRIKLLKLLDSEQFPAFSNLMSQSKNVEELVKFSRKQSTYFKAFKEKIKNKYCDK